MAIWVDQAGEQDDEGEIDQPTPKPAAQVAERIPDRAWSAADYLRAQVLAENKSAVLGARPWDAAAKTGLRLAWADEFRLLHRRVWAAMRNERPDATEHDAWAEVARTVHWLFHGQPTEPRFEVESPRSLAKKWDNIQRARRRQAQPRPARGADNRPDPAAQRQFRTLTKDSL